MTLRTLTIAAMLLIVSVPSWAQEPEIIEGRPIVLDGDTLLFGDTRVRLWGIDAPDMDDWPLGAYSRKAMDDMLILFKDVRCEIVSRDREGRPVGICGTNKISDLGAEMIARGWAVGFRLSLVERPSYVDAYGIRESAARSRGNGIWANPIVPPALP